MKCYIFLAEGFEDSEAVNTIDVLRRAKEDVKIVSITGNNLVTSSHGIAIQAEMLFEDVDFSDGDMLILPGGMPGTLNLKAFAPLIELIKNYYNKGKFIAAICAAPSIFGELGLLNGKKATCFPGFEDKLLGAEYTSSSSEFDGNVITGRSAGNAMLFGLKLVEALEGKPFAENLAKSIVMPE